MSLTSHCAICAPARRLKWLSGMGTNPQRRQVYTKVQLIARMRTAPRSCSIPSASNLTKA